MVHFEARLNGRLDPLVLGRADLHQLRISSWNAGALCHSDTTIRSRKIAHLLRIAGKADILLIQETHACPETADLYLHQLHRHFLFFHSYCLENATGGVLTLIRRSLVRGGSTFFQEVCPARLTRLSIEKENFTITVWNIHNAELSKRSTSEAHRLLKEDCRGGGGPAAAAFGICWRRLQLSA